MQQIPDPATLPRPLQQWRLLLWALMFFFSLLLLTASGRVASIDAGFQLQDSMVLATTGSLGVASLPAGEDVDAWQQGRGGLFYEVHDIGNMLFMLPAALAGVATTPHGALDPFLPPLITRVLVSLCYAALSAVACFYLFRLFLLYVPARSALGLACAFLACTIFWSYTKAAWDVLGACCFVCMMLYHAALLLEGRAPRANLLWTCALLQLAAMFRLSTLPFLTLGLLGVLFFARKRLRWADIALAAAVYLALFTPTLWFNWARTGSPLRPATSLPRFVSVGTADLSGNPWVGAWGLLLSPNKGLLLFCPVLLAAFALPWCWRRVPRALRLMVVAFGTGSVLYIALIAHLILWWGNYGWGPRYLLPVLPVFFLAAACVVMAEWRQHKRRLGLVLSLSFLVNLPTPLINIHLVQSADMRAIAPYAHLPWEMIDAWRALGKGLTGQPLAASADELADPVRRMGAGFPDIWTAYLIRGSHKTAPIGAALTLLLIAGCIVSYRRVMQRDDAARKT